MEWTRLFSERLRRARMVAVLRATILVNEIRGLLHEYGMILTLLGTPAVYPHLRIGLGRGERTYPTVTHEPELSTAYENRGAIFRRESVLTMFAQ
jgi:hypothetical protein